MSANKHAPLMCVYCYEISITDLRHDVLHEILHPDQYSGTSVQSFPLLSSLIKGFRRGELSVLTGGTGAGKTTLLTQVTQCSHKLALPYFEALKR
jgi:replicative DNA helicase